MTSALELRQVSKMYGSGPSEVHALTRGRSLGRTRRTRRHHGPERLWQEHPPDDRRQPRGGDGRHRVSSMASTSVASSRSERAQMRRRSIGYVFQDFNLLPGLTALENVTLPLELDGIPGKAARATGLEAMTVPRRRRARGSLPGRAFGRRAPAGRDSTSHRRRARLAARRRADRCARLRERRGCHASAPRCNTEGRRRRRRHP